MLAISIIHSIRLRGWHVPPWWMSWNWRWSDVRVWINLCLVSISFYVRGLFVYEMSDKAETRLLTISVISCPQLGQGIIPFSSLHHSAWHEWQYTTSLLVVASSL